MTSSCSRSSIPLQHVDAAIRDGLSSKPLGTFLERMAFVVAAYEPVLDQRHDRDRFSPAAARKLRLDRAESLEQDVNRTVGS